MLSRRLAKMNSWGDRELPSSPRTLDSGREFATSLQHTRNPSRLSVVMYNHGLLVCEGNKTSPENTKPVDLADGDEAELTLGHVDVPIGDENRRRRALIVLCRFPNKTLQRHLLVRNLYPA
jgi:hypothetical protein